MKLIALMFALALVGVPLFAQGMTEDYVRERTDEKFSKPHGFSIDWDIYAHVPYFEQQQRVRSGGIGSDGIGFQRDLNGSPIGVFGGTEVRMRFSWHDSINLGYNLYYTRAFEDELDEFKRWNGVIYPENTDLDYEADYHEFHIHYRRDLFRLGLQKNIAFFVKAGLEYAFVRTKVSSDTFPVDPDREVEEFREVLPWYSIGLGTEIEIGQRITMQFEAYGTYQVGVPTFQERDNDDMKHSVVSATAIFSFEWRPVDWFAIVARVRGKYFRLTLYGGFRKDQFLWYSVGPDIGFGLRF